MKYLIISSDTSFKEHKINRISLDRIEPIIVDNNHNGWKIWLNSNNMIKHAIFNPKASMPSIRDDIVGIQRSHLLPNFLKEKCYLRKIINDAGIFVKDKNDKDGFFWLGNSFNIRPQFRDANSAGEENCFWGQQHFEIKFKDHLLKNEFVYYEVEAMYYSSNDKVPIGNRLLAYINYKKTNDWQDYVELFHVFIPNVSQEKWANLIDRESYREFIKKW